MPRMDKIGTHKTRVLESTNGHFSIHYHNTEVFRREGDHVILRTGGWRSLTTKTRMNQAARALNLPFQVRQSKWEWFIEIRPLASPDTPVTLPFLHDGIKFNIRTGELA